MDIEVALVENMVKKNRKSFSHCGSSFDHHAMQSLNNCTFVFLDLPTDTLGILGFVIYRWEGLDNTFPTVYYMSQDIYVAAAKWKINFCSRYVTADHGGEKNRIGKTIAVLFRHVFY